MTSYSKTTRAFLRFVCEKYQRNIFDSTDLPLKLRKVTGSLVSAGFILKLNGHYCLSKEGMAYAKRYLDYADPIIKPTRIQYGGVGYLWFWRYYDEIVMAVETIKTSIVSTPEIENWVRDHPYLAPNLTRKPTTIRRKNISCVLRNVPWSKQVTRTPFPKWEIDRDGMQHPCPGRI